MIKPILLSLKIATISTTIVTIIGVALAYLMIKKEFKNKNIVESLITLPLVLPPSVVGFILLILLGKRGFIGKWLYSLFGFQIVFTWIAAVIAATIVSLPLMYQNVKTALINMDRDYESAALNLGAKPWKIFYYITIPMILPGIINGIILSYARSLGEFGATLMVAGNIPGKTQTIPLAIYFAVEKGDNKMAGMLVLLMTLFSFSIIMFMNKFIKGNARK